MTPSHEDVLLVPLPPDRVYPTAIEAAAAMPRWRIVARRPGDRTLEAVARTRLLRFADDVRVTVEAAVEGGSRVRVRSASRIGLIDFGTNARRVRSYLRRLADLLGPGGVEADDA